MERIRDEGKRMKGREPRDKKSFFKIVVLILMDSYSHLTFPCHFDEGEIYFPDLAK
jgi:hypothetical protein